MTTREEFEKETVIHGINCTKVIHKGEGHLHDENDDTPYDVDGLTYCGRCHTFLYDSCCGITPLDEEKRGRG